MTPAETLAEIARLDPDLLALAEECYRAYLAEEATDPGSTLSGFQFGRASGYFHAAALAMPAPQRWRMDFNRWRAQIERERSAA